MNNFYLFLRLIFTQRELILTLAKREVSTQYVGSSLGVVWTFIHPMVLILVFWVVFSVGFRVTPVNNVPFVVWLTAGMAAWTVFAEIVNGSTGIIVSNRHLIKKTLFQSQVLPLVRIVACLITHSVFLMILLGLIVFQKMPFSLYYFQFIYYLFAMSVLALGLGWAFSALNVFIRDIGQIVGVILQIGFWATPIFWDISIMPQKAQILFKLNPMFYIVQGYRDSFIYFYPVWDRPVLSVYFWGVTMAVFVAGALIFKRLKPQFADIL
ncbi:MAG: ABC transporter permease [Desulfobacteraceae bacterium]|nr:MAG: ABC transporter permease [Desulfobacteraceae bacterium]